MSELTEPKATTIHVCGSTSHGGKLQCFHHVQPGSSIILAKCHDEFAIIVVRSASEVHISYYFLCFWIPLKCHWERCEVPLVPLPGGRGTDLESVSMGMCGPEAYLFSATIMGSIRIPNPDPNPNPNPIPNYYPYPNPNPYAYVPLWLQKEIKRPWRPPFHSLLLLARVPFQAKEF